MQYCLHTSFFSLTYLVWILYVSGLESISPTSCHCIAHEIVYAWCFFKQCIGCSKVHTWSYEQENIERFIMSITNVSRNDTNYQWSLFRHPLSKKVYFVCSCYFSKKTRIFHQAIAMGEANNFIVDWRMNVTHGEKWLFVKKSKNTWKKGIKAGYFDEHDTENVRHALALPITNTLTAHYRAEHNNPQMCTINKTDKKWIFGFPANDRFV